MLPELDGVWGSNSCELVDSWGGVVVLRLVGLWLRWRSADSWREQMIGLLGRDGHRGCAAADEGAFGAYFRHAIRHRCGLLRRRHARPAGDHHAPWPHQQVRLEGAVLSSRLKPGRSNGGECEWTAFFRSENEICGRVGSVLRLVLEPRG